MHKKAFINLDHLSASPILPKAIYVINKYLKHYRENSDTIITAKENIAKLINCKPEEIFFTSSTVESNNLAIRGISYAYKNKGRHIITSQIENLAVLKCCESLQNEGFEIDYIPVDKFGFINPDDIKKSIRNDTILGSFTFAAGEVGTIEPVSKIGEILNERGIVFHCDGSFAVGMVDIDIEKLNVDVLTIEPNNFYGPKGISALFIKNGVRIQPLFQTETDTKIPEYQNISLITATGVAAEVAKKEIFNWQNKLLNLRDKLIKELPTKIPNLYINGHQTIRLPNNISISVEFAEGEAMALYLNENGFYVSTGSRCKTSAKKGNHVLKAIGLNENLIHSSIIITLGIDNTIEDVEKFIDTFSGIVKKIRDVSPLTLK